MRHCECCSRKLGHAVFERELENYRKAAQHNDIAFAAAFHMCATEEKCPPAYLVKAVDELLIELLKGEKSKKRGRAGGRVARCRQDLWDFERFCAVDEVRRIREENPQRLESIKDCTPEERKVFAHFEKVRDWLRYGTFECASMYLAGTFAWGIPNTVRASYRRVRRALTTRSGAFRYYMFFGDFLGRVGIPYPATLRPGNKTTFFYDLKP